MYEEGMNYALGVEGIPFIFTICTDKIFSNHTGVSQYPPIVNKTAYITTPQPSILL